MMCYDTNLKAETLSVMLNHGKKKSDVEWVGNSSFRIPTDLFWELAGATDYDNGYGTAHIPADLLVAGDGWWLERHEYDGSEWWEYKEMPKKPTDEKRIDRLSTKWGDSLEKIASGEVDD